MLLMDELVISYKHRSDWYVGELHKYFYEQFVKKYPKIKFKFIENNDFQFKYNLGDYSNNYPSILNQYNFIITNPKNDKTYINSLNDFAPFCLYPNSGVENFDVVKFSFSSNFSKDLLLPIITYNPTPSFYILENFSDLIRVEKYRNIKREINKAHFLGLMYGKRFDYATVFNQSELFDIQSKDNPNFFKDKDSYFETISKYTMSLSIDGAAKICHRDIESLGIGNLLVREVLEIELHDQLIPNVHYLQILNNEEKSTFSSHNEETKKYFKELIEDRILSTISNQKKTKKIINEGISWYQRNCLPKNQFNLVDTFTKNLSIFFN